MADDFRIHTLGWELRLGEGWGHNQRSDASNIRAGGQPRARLVASWFAHTSPKMPAETGGEFSVLLTTYLVVSLFRALCELLKICPCGIQEPRQNDLQQNDLRPHGWLHNSLFRCTITFQYSICESTFLILFVAGFTLLGLLGRDVVPEHRAAFFLSWRLITMATTILTLVCSRDTSD